MKNSPQEVYSKGKGNKNGMLTFKLFNSLRAIKKIMCVYLLIH